MADPLDTSYGGGKKPLPQSPTEEKPKTLKLAEYPIRSESMGAVRIPSEIYSAFQTLLSLLTTTKDRQGGAIDLRKKVSQTKRPVNRLKRTYWGNEKYAPRLDEDAHGKRAGVALDDIDGALDFMGPFPEDAGRILKHANGILNRIEGIQSPTVIRTEESATIFHSPEFFYKRVIQSLACNQGVLLMDGRFPLDRVPTLVWLDRFIIQMSINSFESAIRAGFSGSTLGKDLQLLRNALSAIGGSLKKSDPEAWNSYSNRTVTRLLPYRADSIPNLPELYLFEDTLEEAEELCGQLLSGDEAALMFFSAVSQPIEGTLAGVHFIVPPIRPILDAILFLREINLAVFNEDLYDEFMTCYAPSILIFLDLHKMVEAFRGRSASELTKRPWARAFEGLDRKIHPLHQIFSNNVKNARDYVQIALDKANLQPTILAERD